MKFLINRFASLCIGDDGKPIILLEHQVRILTHVLTMVDGVFRYAESIYSCPKKSGKTAVGAILGCYVALTRPNSTVVVVANDLEQSVSRVFRDCKNFFERNPILSREVESITQTCIKLKNGSEIKAVASDYKGIAGERHVLAIFDELWAFTDERARRLYEELTPIPTQPSMIFIVTTAGIEAESLLLETLYKRGLAGTHLWPDLPCYENGRLFMYWDHEPRMPWQTPEYYRDQREILRPPTYLRYHENRFVAPQSELFPIAWWDRCATGRPVISDFDLLVVVAIDLGLKSDTLAIAVCAYDPQTNRVILVCHRIFVPTKGECLNIEATLEATIREYGNRFQIQAIYFDPWQMQRTAQLLKAEGFPMVEFPQSVPNLTAMTQNLYDLLQGGNLTAYPSEEIRLAIQRAVIVESTRGMKITKEKSGHKIDCVIAMAMACLGCVQESGQGRPSISVIPGPGRGGDQDELEETEPTFRAPWLEQAVQGGKPQQEDPVLDDFDDDDEPGMGGLQWLSDGIRGRRR